MSGDERYRDAAIRGLDWIFGENELGRPMLDRDAGILYRSIRRAARLDRVLLYANTAMAVGGRAGVLGAAPGSSEPTDRPYHLGLAARGAATLGCTGARGRGPGGGERGGGRRAGRHRAGFLPPAIPTRRCARRRCSSAVAAGHPEGIERLSDFARDPDPGVADAARAAAERLRREPPPLTFRLFGAFEVRRGAWPVDESEWKRRVAARLVRLLRHYRDAPVLAIGGGAKEVMTDLAAKRLGLTRVSS